MLRLGHEDERDFFFFFTLMDCFLDRGSKLMTLVEETTCNIGKEAAAVALQCVSAIDCLCTGRLRNRDGLIAS